MDITGVKSLFDSIREQLSGLGIDSVCKEGSGDPQIGETLRILFPVTPEGDAVITELVVTAFSPELDLLFLYSTIVAKIGERYDELVQKLIPWNMGCPFGAYGIYEEERQLYHKYTLPFPNDADPADVAGQALVMLGILNEVLSERYREAETYSVR